MESHCASPTALSGSNLKAHLDYYSSTVCTVYNNKSPNVHTLTSCTCATRLTRRRVCCAPLTQEMLMLTQFFPIHRISSKN